jgi:hypothetical protein
MQDQLIPVDHEVILKSKLGGNSLLNFVKPEFAALALKAYQLLGSPPISSCNAWQVFSDMLMGITEALASFRPSDILDLLSAPDVKG